MSASVKLALGAVVALGAALGLAAALSVFPFESDDGGQPPPPTASIDDGKWFAMVTVGEDETGAMTLGVDLAEMLTGEEARQAAIADGVIGEDEDLPNDFYIDNPDRVYELIRMGENSEIEVISGDDVNQTLSLDPSEFAALYQGTYVGSPVYGVVPNEPMAMNVTIQDGLAVSASAVYLP